jgi:hypothetical protein
MPGPSLIVAVGNLAMWGGAGVTLFAQFSAAAGLPLAQVDTTAVSAGGLIVAISGLLACITPMMKVWAVAWLADRQDAHRRRNRHLEAEIALLIRENADLRVKLGLPPLPPLPPPPPDTPPPLPHGLGGSSDGIPTRKP